MSRLFPGKDHSVTSADARLDTLRGSTAPLSHTARTIAALTANPGCARRAVLDAAGADKTLIAAHAGFPQASGASQSPFALGRGAAFETQVKANGAADLIRLLRGKLGLTLPEVSYADLETGRRQHQTATSGTGGHARCCCAPPVTLTRQAPCMTTRCCGCRSAATGPTWNRTWSHSRSAAGSTSSRSSRSR